MLRVSARIGSAPVRHDGSKTNDELLQARDLLLRASATMPIGTVFLAESMPASSHRSLAQSHSRRGHRDRQIPGALVPRVELLDYDADGTNELLFTSLEAQVLLKPGDGGTIAALDFRPAAATLVNSILRRPEAYHHPLARSCRKARHRRCRLHSRTDPRERARPRALSSLRSLARHAFRVLIFDPASHACGLRSSRIARRSRICRRRFTVKSSAQFESFVVRMRASWIENQDAEGVARPAIVAKKALEAGLFHAGLFVNGGDSAGAGFPAASRKRCDRPRDGGGWELTSVAAAGRKSSAAIVPPSPGFKST